MSELAIKKLAEVAAFRKLASDILSNADEAFTERAADCRDLLQLIADTDIDLPTDADELALYDTKTAKTHTKLSTMMELYIGDEWDNPTEILEWCSFYSGAGAAHCAIAGHLAAGDGKENTAAALHQLQQRFAELLDKVIGKLAS